MNYSVSLLQRAISSLITGPSGLNNDIKRSHKSGKDGGSRGQSALIGVAIILVDRTNAPTTETAKPRTNMRRLAYGYANRPSLNSSDFCRRFRKCRQAVALVGKPYVPNQLETRKRAFP